MKNRRKKPGVKLTRAQKKKLEELTRQAKADGRHPNSAQKTIPYLSMYKDGLCRVTENYYTMSLLFDDMNYDLEDEAEQLGIFGGWCSFYSYFDCAVHVQMTGINSENDPEAFARALAVLERNEAYRTLCAEYVQLLQTQYMRSNNGQTRIKLMTFGIESESVKGARSRLTRIGLDMQGNFKKIGVESVLMDGKERLSLLHALFHMDDHAPFVFEWSWLPETGLSTKDFIAPGSFDFSPSRSFKIGETYCAASYIQIQTSSLSKKLLGELLRLPSSAVFSLHVQPMDQMTAIKLIKQKQVVLDATKISEQQKAFRSGYDIDIIPRDIDAYGDDTKRLLQTLGTNEKLYMATIVVMNMAGSKRAPRVVTREILDVETPDWHTSTPDVDVKYYTFDPQNQRVFYVYPPNTGTGSLEVVYAVSPPELADGDALQVDSVWLPALVNYVMYRCYSKDAEYAANANLAVAYYQAFTNLLAGKTSAEAALDARQNSVGTAAKG